MQAGLLPKLYLLLPTSPVGAVRALNLGTEDLRGPSLAKGARCLRGDWLPSACPIPAPASWSTSRVTAAAKAGPPAVAVTPRIAESLCWAHWARGEGVCHLRSMPRLGRLDPGVGGAVGSDCLHPHPAHLLAPPFSFPPLPSPPPASPHFLLASTGRVSTLSPITSQGNPPQTLTF